MEKNDVPVTYETLFEVVMREKGREELQKLDKDFYKNVQDYIAQKQELLHTQGTDPFSLQRKERTIAQLKNVRRLVRELYERRERKVINMAIVRSRTQSHAMDVSALLPAERALFEDLIEKLDDARNAELKDLMAEVVRPRPAAEEKKKIRFKSDVPRFVGRDLSTYGPFEAQSTTELPAMLADILIQKGSAEEL